MTGLLENPFVLFLLGTVATFAGSIGSKLIDRAFGRADGDAAMAGRLATIEAMLSHVTADQEAHKTHGLQLALMDRRMEGLERLVRQALKQNLAIWKRINAPAT